MPSNSKPPKVGQLHVQIGESKEYIRVASITHSSMYSAKYGIGKLKYCTRKPLYGHPSCKRLILY